jgi:hypothetical protein
MKSKYILPAIAFVFALSSSGFAQEPITVIELIDHLEEAVRDCDWKTRNLTGAPKGKMLLHKRTMEDVLDGLKAGRVVDSRKLEEALKVHPS